MIDQNNDNIQPLPNLETKFVVANTLIGVEIDNNLANMIDFKTYLPENEKDKKSLEVAKNEQQKIVLLLQKDKSKIVADIKKK